MQRLVLASHGYLAEGMKNSAQIIGGEVRRRYILYVHMSRKE